MTPYQCQMILGMNREANDTTGRYHYKRPGEGERLSSPADLFALAAMTAR